MTEALRGKVLGRRGLCGSVRHKLERRCMFYKMKYLNTFKFIILLLLLMSLLSCASFSNKIDKNWACYIDNDVAKSKRYYLIVSYDHSTNDERKINVTSECQIPVGLEGVYGECIHNIFIQPTNKSLTIDTGEDVVIIDLPNENFPLIFGTIRYGCCGGPDTVNFYTENGKYIGALEGFNLLARANTENVMIRSFDMKNVISIKKKIYMIVEKEYNSNDYQVAVIDNSDNIKMIPLVLPISDQEKEKCDFWHIDDFWPYSDREDITLKIKASFCHYEVFEEQEYSCYEAEDGIICLPTNIEKNENITGSDIGLK